MTLADLARHRCTGFRHRETGRLWPWELMVDGALQRVDPPASFCFDEPEAELDAIVAGMGIGLIDSINAAQPLRAGLLVALLPQHASAHLGFYLYYARRDAMPRRLRAFVDFMIERLRDAPEFQLGASEFAAPRRARAR